MRFDAKHQGRLQRELADLRPEDREEIEAQAEAIRMPKWVYLDTHFGRRQRLGQEVRRLGRSILAELGRLVGR